VSLTRLRWSGEAWWLACLVFVMGYCLSVCSLSTITSSAWKSTIAHLIVKMLKVWRHRQLPTPSESTLQRPREALSASPTPKHSISLTFHLDTQLNRTYRKVATPVMTLVMHQVRQSSRPTARHGKQLFWEERVPERLVEEGWGRSGRCPLWLINVLKCGIDFILKA
jgi:hypothetical protein